MLSLQQIPHETIYIALSAIIAVIIFFEGQTLKATEGKVPSSTLFHIGSLIDTLWLLVSVVCFSYLTFQSVQVCVPVAYGIYKLFGIFHGVKLIKADGIPDDPDDLVIPPRMIAYDQSFAIIFFALCVFVLFVPMPIINLPFAIPRF